jgi:hypothetical protein
MRYVETCSRTTWSAFARALACGNCIPANGPVSNVVNVGGGSSSEAGVLTLESSSGGDAGTVLGEGESSSRAAPTPLLFRGFGGGFNWAPSATSGKSFSRIRVIAARWEPASTARTEFLDHFEAVERTRKPVTLSSHGPPPEP